MRGAGRHRGLTLAEQTVVIAIIVLLVNLSIPAGRSFLNSLETQSGAKAMISSAMASARAIAAKEQKYAGIRFQNRYQQDGKGCQYMIFIVNDLDKTGLVNGFRAVEGIEPIKLPDSVGVMEPVNSNAEIDDNPSGELTNKTTFSILFSPSGKLVIHDVRIRNRDGERDTSGTNSYDDIFNKKRDVDKGIGMFYQDDYANLGLDEESSLSRFIIYDKTVFNKIDAIKRWSDYLKDQKVIYISPYTGTMIE